MAADVTTHNRSVVCNYDGHGPLDAPGQVQFTLSYGVVFITVDGRPVGKMPEAEFARVKMLWTS